MKRKLILPVAIFLLLGGILSSEMGLYFLGKRIPRVSPSYLGWGEPSSYVLSREDSNGSHHWIMFLQMNGVVCLIGLLMIHIELRRHAFQTEHR